MNWLKIFLSKLLHFVGNFFRWISIWASPKASPTTNMGRQNMNGILNFLSALCALTGDTLRRITNSAWCIILAALAIYFVQLIWENMIATAIVAFICDLIVLYSLLNPRRLMSVFALGEGAELIGLTEPIRPGSRLFEVYWSSAMYLLFWVHALCFFAPLAPLKDNPLIGYFLLIGGVAVIIMYPGGKAFRRIATWAIVFTLILMLFRLPSPAWWIKIAGGDPFGAVRVSMADQTFAKTLQSVKDAEDKKAIKQLEDIQRKVSAGGQLSPADKKFLKERNYGLFQKVIESLSSAEKIGDKVLSQAEPLLDIDLASSQRTTIVGDDIVIGQGGYAVIKFFVKNPPASTEKKPAEILITLKSSGSKQLSYTVNGRKYETFLDGFGRVRLGLTSEIISDVNSLAIAGDSDLVINGKEVVTIAKF